MLYDVYEKYNWLRAKHAIFKQFVAEDVGSILVETEELPVINDIVRTLGNALKDTLEQDLDMDWCIEDVREHFRNIQTDVQNCSDWIDDICRELDYEISPTDISVVYAHYRIPKATIIDHAAKRGPVRSAIAKATYQLKIFIDDIMYRQEVQRRYRDYLDEALSNMSVYVNTHYKTLGRLLRDALYNNGEYCVRSDETMRKHGFLFAPDGDRLYVKTPVGTIQC